MTAPTGERAATDAIRNTATPIENEGEANDPSIPSAAYKRMEARWKKCRDCFMGTEAIRAGGEDYLPRYEHESPARYHARRMIAAFYNGFSRTVLASVGMLLQEEPALNDDMPDLLQQYWENIDAQGTHGAVFTRKLATGGTIDGYAGILVEHSRPDDPNLDTSKASAAAAIAIRNRQPLSADDEQALGLRPYFLLFRVSDVFKEVYETVNGVKTLVLLVLRETVRKRVGLFGTKVVTQYRVYTNTRGLIEYQLWAKPDSGGSPTVIEQPRTIVNQSSIPWSPFPAGEQIAEGEWKPPLLDLADLNIQYHNTLTNILSLQALAFVPTPVRIGARPDEKGDYPPIVLGPGNTIEAPQMEGVQQPIYWLSPPVDVLAPGEKTLAATKADMGAMGAAFLSEETRAAETAEAKRIDSAAQRATLSSVGRALKDCLEQAFVFMARYKNLEAGSVTLNEDFTGEGIDPQYLAVLVQAYQEDVLTLEELRYVIQTGQLPEDFDAGDTLSLIAAKAAREEAARLAREASAGARSGASNQGDGAAA